MKVYDTSSPVTNPLKECYGRNIKPRNNRKSVVLLNERAAPLERHYAKGTGDRYGNKITQELFVSAARYRQLWVKSGATINVSEYTRVSSGRGVGYSLCVDDTLSKINSIISKKTLDIAFDYLVQEFNFTQMGKRHKIGKNNVFCEIIKALEAIDEAFSKLQENA